MKNYVKYLLIILLSFLSFFNKIIDLNIILLIPLLAFCMSNGIRYFLSSLLGIVIASFIYYQLTSSYIIIVYMLIGLTLYFLMYHFLLLLNKKIFINYLISISFSILITYALYMYNFSMFNILLFVKITILSLIVCFLFAYLLKKFSLHLLMFEDDYGYIILAILIILYLSNISYFSYYIALSIFICFVIYCISKFNTTHGLTFVSGIIFSSMIFDIKLINQNIFIVLLISFLFALKLFKNRLINFFLVLFAFIVNYYVNKDNHIIYYVFSMLACSVLSLFIKVNENKNRQDIYFNQYIENKKDIINCLDNIEDMFTNISNNFKLSYENEILRKCKNEVFDTLCFNCKKINQCYKKDKHILLNYIKDLLNDTLDDHKINNIKNNCIRHEAYFSLLDKFTTTYLIYNYKLSSSYKLKEIISSDFNSFANIINKCKLLINKDNLYKINHFYKDLKEELKNKDYDILFIKDLSNTDCFCYDIAIKNINIDKFKNKVLPIINDLLDTYMEVSNVDYSTLTFNYLIISIIEIKKLSISYYYRQSNEDVNANGDSLLTYESNKQFYVSLSDGMGNGIKANEESEFSLNTLFSMIKTKMDVKSSIITTNDLIKIKNDEESFTTLDLLAINKYSHIASFYKMGAVSSYIIRNHHVTKVNNYSLPLGILEKIIINPSSYKLESKDIIILCSDGMIDDNNEIVNILESISYDKADIICNMLFSQLLNIRKNIDDATIIVVTIN